MTKRARPRLAVSFGDPAGIGPEIARKAMGALRRVADFLIFDSPYQGRLGRPSAASGRCAAINVILAANAARSGQADALVTAPLSKEALKLAGFRWPGHTELLAELCGRPPEDVGMLLQGGGLRVFLATRHVSLREAIRRCEPKRLSHAIEVCAKGLRESFGIRRPRLALAAMNPHAGEAGAFGDDEVRVLRPLVRKYAGRRDLRLSGPWPADTVFAAALQGGHDAVVCLYHDQGLIPLKLLAFDSGVNITLGLPIVRTSPDHGTAYDIAGKGKASPDSMIAAMRLALELVKRRG